MRYQDCGCRPRPPAPPPPNGYLLPRILGYGKQWIRCKEFDMPLQPCACRTQMPLTLIGVSACGQTPCFEERETCKKNTLLLCVMIPVICEVRDNCGCITKAVSEIEVPLEICLSCHENECWRHHIALFPCVRLIKCVTSCDGCFHAMLEVIVEGYCLSYRPLQTGGGCPPPCPDLPLYPQPFHPSPPCC